MPRNPLDFDDVFEIGRSLPDVREAAGRLGSSLKFRGRMIACPAIHKSAEPSSLVVRVGFDEREELIAGDPDVYYVTDHYLDYPSVLVRLDRIGHDALTDLLRMACRFTGSARKRGSAQARRPRSGPA